MFDLVTLINAAGYSGLFAIVFAESGLFFGFFLPGDSLLFTAGFIASTGKLEILILIPLLFAAAVLGDNVGYAFGRRIGPALFTKKESRFFKPAHVTHAHQFFLRHGKKAVFLARFLPIVRTFVPIIAGVATMPRKEFMTYNIFGGAVWVIGLLTFGYVLGKQIPNAEHYLYPIVLAIIVLSFLPTAHEVHKARRQKKPAHATPDER